MPVGNGGIIGPCNPPSLMATRGVWRLAEAQVAVEAGMWPRTMFAPGSAGEDQADLAQYTFSSAAYGGPAMASRIVVAFVVTFSSALTLTSVTIGGVSATILGPASGDNARTWIVYASVPSGTSGTIVVQFSGTAPNCYYGCWSLYPETAAPVSSSFPTGGPATSRSVTLDIPEGAIAILGAGRVGAGGGWTNAIENPMGPSSGSQYAYRGPLAAGETGTVITNSNTRTICGAVWL